MGSNMGRATVRGMGSVVSTWKNWTLTTDALITPTGIIHPLENVPDYVNKQGKRSRGRVKFMGKWIYTYRAVMHVMRQTKRLPDGDIHHINANRHDCRPANLVILDKDNHNKAHKILAEVIDSIDDIEKKKSEYIEFCHLHDKR